MGDASRNTGRAVMAGRAGKPKPRRRGKQEGPERPVSFEDAEARLTTPADGLGIEGINVVGQPEIPIPRVAGPTMREQAEGMIDNLSPAQRIALGAAAAISQGKISGRVALGGPSPSTLRPARQRP